jgi:glutaredoxin
MSETLTLYWRPGCPYCMKLKARLRLGRVPFDGVNIWADPGAAGVVRAANNGDELVPTVRVGDRYLSNPTYREVRAALDRSA